MHMGLVLIRKQQEDNVNWSTCKKKLAEIEIKKWEPVFQELKREVRERNARPKQQQKMAGKHSI